MYFMYADNIVDYKQPKCAAKCTSMLERNPSYRVTAPSIYVKKGGHRVLAVAALNSKSLALAILRGYGASRSVLFHHK